MKYQWSSCRPQASTRNSPSIPTLRVGPRAGWLAPLLRPHAIDVVAKLPGVAGFHQAVDVGIESGKLLVEVARELKELDDRAVEALARNQQRNARWIRRQQHAGHAAFELVD